MALRWRRADDGANDRIRPPIRTPLAGACHQALRLHFHQRDVMRKLRLRPEELRVESFPTAREKARTGTVLGNEAPTYWLPGCYTSPDYGSTCEQVYTCPECASPPETQYQCGPPEETFPC
jgi:hypothetical protein